MKPPRIEWRPDGPHAGRFWDVEHDFEVAPQEVAAAYNRLADLVTDPARSGAQRPPDALCLPCVRCGRGLQPVWETAQDGARLDPEPPRAQPLDGTTLRGQPAYGSEHDFEDNGRQVEINLCDDCLSVAGSLGRVNLTRELRTVHVQHYRWTPDREAQ